MSDGSFERINVSFLNKSALRVYVLVLALHLQKNNANLFATKRIPQLMSRHACVASLDPSRRAGIRYARCRRFVGLQKYHNVVTHASPVCEL